MLLRRFTQHVKTQNWFAVGIDFLIVVIGVFVGLQVSNWNNEANDKIKAERLLTRLESDLLDMRMLNLQHKELHKQKLDALFVFVNRMEADDIPADNENVKTFDLALSTTLPPNVPLSFDEMLATGGVDLLQSASLRESLRSLGRNIDKSEKAGDFMMKIFELALQELRPYYRIAIIPFAQMTDSTRHASIDAAKLWADPEARSVVEQLYEFHAVMLTINIRSLTFIDAAIAEIQAETSK